MVIYGQQKLPIRFLMPVVHVSRRPHPCWSGFDVLCFCCFCLVAVFAFVYDSSIVSQAPPEVKSFLKNCVQNLIKIGIQLYWGQNLIRACGKLVYKIINFLWKKY